MWVWWARGREKETRGWENEFWAHKSNRLIQSDFYFSNSCLVGSFILSQVTPEDLSTHYFIFERCVIKAAISKVTKPSSQSAFAWSVKFDKLTSPLLWLSWGRVLSFTLVPCHWWQMSRQLPNMICSCLTKTKTRHWANDLQSSSHWSERVPLFLPTEQQQKETSPRWVNRRGRVDLLACSDEANANFTNFALKLQSSMTESITQIGDLNMY